MVRFEVEKACRSMGCVNILLSQQLDSEISPSFLLVVNKEVFHDFFSRQA